MAGACVRRVEGEVGKGRKEKEEKEEKEGIGRI